MNRAARPARLRMDEVGDALLVSSGGANPATAAVARALPREPDRLGVVMSDPELVFHPEFVYRLRRFVPARGESVRLVAPRGAAADQSARIPAQELAEQLDVDVLAPDGELVAVPGGSLFVQEDAGHAGTGHWWRHRPGREPLPAGRRYPVPDWEHHLADLPDLPDLADSDLPGLALEQIPAGLWLRWRNGPSGLVHPDDLAYAIPIQADGMALLVSRPSDPPLHPADLRRVIEAVPPPLRERLIVTPYGDAPVGGGELGAIVSAAANRTLRVRTGLPLRLTGFGQQIVAIGADGLPTWMPFATQMAWRPHGGARVLSWNAPTDGLLPAGHAQLMLNERWLVEVLEAGLWVREADRTEGAGAVRRLPLAADHCTVVVGVGDTDQMLPPWRALDRMLQRLPAPALIRLRVVVPAAAGKWFADAVAKGCRRYVGEAGPIMLTAAGRLVLAGTVVDQAPPVADQPTAQAGVAPTVAQDGRAAFGQAVSGQAAFGQSTAEHGAPQQAAQQAGPMPQFAQAGRRQRSTDDEVSDLLRFVDEIRRTPAWDEHPDEPGEVRPAAAPAGGQPPASSASSVSPRDGEEGEP